MANTRKYNKYYVIDEDILKSGLKGGELLVYALINAYCKAGHQYNGSIKNIMERTNVGRRQVLTILQRLVAKGYIKKVQNEVIKSECAYELCGAEIAPEGCGNCTGEVVQKLHLRGAEIARGRCRNCTGEVQKLHGGGAEIAPPYNNVYIKDYTKDYTKAHNVCVRARAEEEEEKKINGVVHPAGSQLAKEQHELEVRVGIMEGWKRHYHDLFGKEYLLRGCITQEVSDLVPAIEQLMESEGKPVTTDGVADYTHRLFNRMHNTANKWQLENWNLRVITRQFNELLNNGEQRNSAKASERPREIADASQFIDRL